MRLLFICKRHPQQRDLISRPYGRFYFLPTCLSAQGHAVRVQLSSYRKLRSDRLDRDGVEWSSHDFLTLGPLKVWRLMLAEARQFRPDWIIGCSDTWAGWLAYRLARRLSCSLAVDAYDNFESYMPFILPLHIMWRRAVAAADIVTAAGPQLATLLQHIRSPLHKKVDVLPMTADPAFVPLDRAESRSRLNLPLHRPLLGYSGAWTRSRGSASILDAFAQVRRILPDAGLVLTGKPPVEAISAEGVVPLGYLADGDMPHVLNAIDLSCVMLADTAFGRFSYPAKLYESMACQVPVVASATDPVKWILNEDSRFLAPLGNTQKYALKILENLEMQRSEYSPQLSWSTLARNFSCLLSQ